VSDHNHDAAVHAWNEQSVKTQATLLASGHIPLVSWTAAPTTTASAIAAGKQDTQIRHMALALKALPGKVFLRPFFEFDQPPGMPRYIGTPSQVIAAWRRTYTMFHNLGATNVRFVWCPMAYNFGPSRRIDARLFWPGSGYVDWIGGDSYNYPNRHWYSFGELFGPEYAWAVLQQKPMMVAETGSPVNDSRTPAWIAGASSWVKAHPDLRALVFFDATGRDGTPYQLLTHQAVLKAFRAVAGDAFFNP